MHAGTYWSLRAHSASKMMFSDIEISLISRQDLENEKKKCKAWIYMGRAYVYKWTTSVRKLRRNATQKCSFVPKCTLGQFFFLLLTASYQLFFLDAKHPSRAELHPYLYHPVFSFCYSCLFFSVNFSRKVVGLFLFIRMINFKIY